MKKILFLTVLSFCLLNGDAQTKVEIKNDTLFVPIGKVKFIKIGDKVYSIDFQLSEVPKPVGMFQGVTPYVDTALTNAPNLLWGGTFPILKGIILLPNQLNPQ